MASSNTSTAELLADSNIVGSRLSMRVPIALGVGVVMLAISLWLGVKSEDPSHFARIYLQSFMFVLAICLGAFFFVFIQHVTKASWSIAVRRPAECIMQNLRWIWILFLPIAYLAFTNNLYTLYPWADLEQLAKVAPAEADLVKAKAGYFAPGFFWTRAALYFLIWGGLAWFFWRSSVRQDETGDVRASALRQKVAAPTALLFGITVSLAAFDWIMSLTPAWFSTMFGVYFFTVCCTAGFSMVTMFCLGLQRAGYLRGIITTEHYQDLGKMIFAFGVVFWAYIAFSQYMLQWYANIPEETTWFLVRQSGGWIYVSVALLVGHFILPFVFLISRWTKRWRGTLMFACVWMLFFAWLDIYYLVMPVVPHDLGKFNRYDDFVNAYAGESNRLADPLNWTLLIGMVALVVAGTAAAARRHPLVAKKDPWLTESLHFQNM